jgi:hypothetical protein
MTSLSPQAQAVLDASNLHPCKDSCLILAAALRAAADSINHATSAHMLYAIADELEGVKYGTYRCDLKGK